MAFIVIGACFWVFAIYPIPFLGRVDKFALPVGLAMAGGTALRRRGDAQLPAMVRVGAVAVVTAVVVSWAANAEYPQGGKLAVYLVGLVAYMGVTSTVLDQSRWIGLSRRCLIGAGLLCAAVVVVISIQKGVGFVRFGVAQPGERSLAQSIWIAPFYSAQFAPIAALLLLEKSRGRAWWRVGAAAAIFGAAFIAYFRREILVSAAILIGWVVVTRDGRTRRNALIVGVLLLSAAALEFARGDESLLRSRLRDNVTIVEGRELRVVNAVAEWEALAEHPLFGSGPGSHGARIEAWLPFDSGISSAFNVYGSLAIEYGLVAALGYILILAGVARAAREMSRSRRGWYGDVSAVVDATPVLTLQVALWGVFGNSWEGTVGWFVLGLGLAAIRVEKSMSGTWRGGVAERTEKDGGRRDAGKV